VPRTSARARCRIEYIAVKPPLYSWLLFDIVECVSQTVIPTGGFVNRQLRRTGSFGRHARGEQARCGPRTTSSSWRWCWKPCAHGPGWL